jgi:hypothetical protein
MNTERYMYIVTPESEVEKKSQDWNSSYSRLTDKLMSVEQKMN